MGIPWIGRRVGRWALLAPLVAGLLPSIGVLSTVETARAQSVDCLAVIVPAYFDDAAAWSAMADAGRVDLIVVNPASGVGKRRNAATAARIAEAQDAGARVVGYVRTGLAKRKPREVRREISRYRAWYGVDGIFLDQVQTEQRYLGYYRKLSRFIRASDNGGRFVVMNPGFTPAPAYLEIADVVVNYEYFHNRYARQDFPDWIYNYPESRFAHVIHDVPNEAALAATLAEARLNHAGYVFVTDRDDPRQYRSLPGFWDEKLSRLC